MKRKLEPGKLAAAGLTRLPKSINGIPVDIAVGTVSHRESYLTLELMGEARRELIANYKKPTGMSLVEFNEPMEVVAQDAGWPMLEPFFGRVKKKHGSWLSSNQGSVRPDQERRSIATAASAKCSDWHILLTNKPLALLLEKYLLREEEQAAQQRRPCPRQSPSSGSPRPILGARTSKRE
jgi:hypothetical protein